MLYFFLSRMRTPRGNGPQTNPMDLYKTIFKVNTLMVQLSTRFSWSVKLESKQARETIKTISKVLRVAKETIRTHVRKKT